MTAADWIAAAILTAFALLITLHQHHEHRSTTTTAKPQDGDRP